MRSSGRTHALTAAVVFMATVFAGCSDSGPGPRLSANPGSGEASLDDAAPPRDPQEARVENVPGESQAPATLAEIAAPVDCQSLCSGFRQLGCQLGDCNEDCLAVMGQRCGREGMAYAACLLQSPGVSCEGDEVYLDDDAACRGERAALSACQGEEAELDEF